MSNIFLPNTMMGTLYYKKVYEFFEEPRFFSVENEVNSLFIVYWIGEDDESDSWFVVPISPARLELIERKRIDIRDALINQEQHFFYELKAPYDRSVKPEWDVKSIEQIHDFQLPASHLFISSVAPVLANGRIGEPIKYSTHEIHLEKSSKSSSHNLVLSHVSNVCDRFSELYEGLLEYTKEKDKLRPVDARPGSFILSFQAEKLSAYEDILKTLSSLMEKRVNIFDFIKNNGIDIQAFSNLLQSIVSTGTNMELKSNQTGEMIFVITKAGASYYLKDITRLSNLTVGGHQIPQADLLDTVFKVVEVKWSGEPCTVVNTGLNERHVYYYQHAAKVLGLLDSYGKVTTVGQQLVQADNNLKYKIAARCFEVSHCGWAWINWAEVENLSQLDPDSAEQFLLEQCHSLSRDTVIRRATTMKKWCRELKDNYVPL
ncbi:TPA: hypothetical protein RGJ92_003329 [Cronobacter sakazakii]|nr:hypothetical protein [Cronobacter sakazakii]